MINLHFHQTNFQIGDFNKILDYLFKIFEDLSDTEIQGIHVFPELFLTGYPLQDLVLDKNFINNYLKSINKLKNEMTKKSTTKKLKNAAFLLGGLDYEFENNHIKSIYNCIYLIDSKNNTVNIYNKRLLPNYDIFDEKKYFNEGKEIKVQEILGINCAMLICEDMWKSSFHKIDPVKEYQEYGKEKIDLVINLSASPFNYKKNTHRLNQAKKISNLLEAPFAYINHSGGEDEIIFDGGSFLCQSSHVLKQMNFFERSYSNFELDIKKSTKYQTVNNNENDINSWNELFKPNLNYKSSPPKLDILNDSECTLIIGSLIYGIYEYCKKTKFNKITIALSGGMDSCLVLAIAYLAKLKYPDQIIQIDAIFMPSKYSSDLSYQISKKICDNIKIPLKNLPIKFVHNVCAREIQDNLSMNLEGLANENIQSRLRGTLLYAYSNMVNSVVLNTSNKSELAVGYSTIYGDSVGALSVIGDLYKSEVYTLANFINNRFSNIIPKEVINRPATAELRENQTDQDSLPEYSILDSILELILSLQYSREDIINLGFEEEQVNKIFNLYNNSEYKRYQFCPIIKVKSKSFGFGHRIPITKYNNIFNKQED